MVKGWTKIAVNQFDSMSCLQARALWMPSTFWVSSTIKEEAQAATIQRQENGIALPQKGGPQYLSTTVPYSLCKDEVEPKIGKQQWFG